MSTHFAGLNQRVSIRQCFTLAQEDRAHEDLRLCCQRYLSFEKQKPAVRPWLMTTLA